MDLNLHLILMQDNSPYHNAGGAMRDCDHLNINHIHLARTLTRHEPDRVAVEYHRRLHSHEMLRRGEGSERLRKKSSRSLQRLFDSS